MAKKTQRVKYMEEHFMEFHNEGLSIPEIAVKCEVTTTTIYQKLQEIAKSNGVTREELLERVHPPHIVVNVTHRQGYTDFNEVLNLAKDLENQISMLINEIHNLRED